MLSISKKFSIDDIYQPEADLIFKGSETEGHLLHFFGVDDVKISKYIAS